MVQNYRVTLTCVVCFNAEDLNVDLNNYTAFGFIFYPNFTHGGVAFSDFKNVVNAGGGGGQPPPRVGNGISFRKNSAE